MRSWVFVLGVILLSAALAAAEQTEEVLLGRIAAIDRETGIVTLSVLSRDGGEETSPPETVQIKTGTIPGHLRPGGLVRAWGSFIGGGARFTAVRLVPAGGASSMRPDPTGVRRRLGMGRQAGPGSLHRTGHR